MRDTIVILAVGATPRLLARAAPNLDKLAKTGAQRPLRTITPAVTCSVQASFLTGTLPEAHGAVANGWYFRDLAEIWFWRQSHHLISGEKVWEAAKKRNPGFTCANMFWWYNMYSGADIGVTPRPAYTADGRKIPDCYTAPGELREELTRLLGPFPLFSFWGPNANIESTRWIARSALHVRKTRKPTLTLIYLPHLDYALQQLGPDHPDVLKEVRELDQVCGEIIEDARRDSARVLVLSEYGITPVSRPIDINRALRREGLVKVREELGLEQFDPGASAAFAVADHQIAHIYVARRELVPSVEKLVSSLPGVERVLDEDGKKQFGLDHRRSGELIAIAEPDSWFSYYYWLDDAKAPDYARTVDIHRKPGYDPVELLLDPNLRFPRCSVAWRLAKRKLGLRTLLDVIPLDATLIKGSHGRLTDSEDEGPVLISSEPDLLPQFGPVSALDIKDVILSHVFEDEFVRSKTRSSRPSLEQID